MRVTESSRNWPADASAADDIRKQFGVEGSEAAGTAAICLLDSSGIIVDPSPDYCRLLGYARGELVGRHWSTTVPEGKLKQAQREFARFHAHGASTSVSAIRRKDGTVVTGICVAVRISDDRYAAAFLRLNERDGRWKTWCQHYDCVPCPISILNREGVVLFANDAAAALVGIARSELVGRRLDDLLPDIERDELRLILERVDRHGIRRGKWSLQGLKGQNLIAEWYITCTPDSDYMVTIPNIFGWEAALLTLQATEVPDEQLPTAPGVFQHGDLVIDEPHRRVWRAGVAVFLTPTEFAVLQVLMENRERVMPAEEILDATWSETDRTSVGLVRTVISRLRAKIEEDHADPHYIVTIPGHGYAFVTSGAPIHKGDV